MLTKSTLGAAVGAALLFGAPTAQAAPAFSSPQPLAAAQDASTVTDVRYYRRGWRRGPGVGAAIGLGILGGFIASQAYRDRYYYDYGPTYYRGPSYRPYDPRYRCASEFRSFEWDTGLYTTYGGERKLCPYL